MTSPTPEQEAKIQENLYREACLVGAIEAVNVAVANEEDAHYREYLDTTVREFLEEEHKRACVTHEEDLREAGLRKE